jgi:nucleotide-binding universal stress UspA family protein
MHRARFKDMEPGLPDGYQGEGLESLRTAHDGLIHTGMKTISEGYLEPLAKKALEKGITYQGITLEGRNYVQLLSFCRQSQPDLTILGAFGHGREKDLGSTAERYLLYSQGGDVLLMRQPWYFEDRPVVVAVDGSEISFLALQRAAKIAASLCVKLNAISAYDPFFHTEVFKRIASSLYAKAMEGFDLPSQERIHDEIIDKGLETLYRNELEKGVLKLGGKITTEVLAGKACHRIQEYALRHDAGLIVLGRWGLHREPGSLIGSNALRLARQSATNVLVVSP